MARLATSLFVVLVVVLPGSPRHWSGPLQAMAFDGSARVERERTTLQEAWDLQWKLGAIARDQQDDPITAAHYFFRAAQSARQAGREDRASDFLLAAQNAAGAVERTLVHDGTINDAVFSPDGRFILTASDDRTARLWDARNGRLVRTFEQHAGTVRRAVFSPDGQRIFTWGRQSASSGDVHSRLWEVSQERPLREFGDRFGRIEDVVFTPDSSRFFIWNHEQKSWDAKRKGTLWLWDVERDEAVFSIQDYVETPNRQGPSPPLIVHAPRPPLTSKEDFDAWRADFRQKKQFVRGLAAGAVGAVFSADATRVLTWTHWADSALLWDVAQKKHLQTFAHIRVVAGAAFNGDATRVLIWNDDGGTSRSQDFASRVQVWHLEGHHAALAFQSPSKFQGVAFDPRGDRILVWSEDGTARLWNLDPPGLLRSFRHEDSIYQALLNEDATRLFTRSVGAVQMWDTGDGRLLQTFRHREEFRGRLEGPRPSADETRFLTFNANHTLDDEVVLSTDRGLVWVWDVERETPLRALEHDGWITDAVFNADGSRVLSGSEDGTVRLWDVERNKLLRTFQHKGYVLSVRFNEDESRILVRTSSSTPRFVPHDGDAVCLWDAADEGEPLHRFRHGRMRDAVLNSHNTRLLTFGEREARLWDVKTGEVVRTFRFAVHPGSEETAEQTFELPIRPDVEQTIRAASFEDDTPRILTWHIPRRHPRRAGEENEERVWEMGKKEPVESRPILTGISPRNANRDATRALRHHHGGIVELYSIDQQEPLVRFRSPRRMALLSYRSGSSLHWDQTRILTWGGEPSHQGASVVHLWDITLRDERPIDEQQLDHEIRTATRLDHFGRSRVLGYNEWRELAQVQRHPGVGSQLLHPSPPN